MHSLTPILCVRSLTKTYRRGVLGQETSHTVLRNLNLDIYAKERVAIVGTRGAGKTTLLYCLAGLLPPTSGTVQWYIPHNASGTPDVAVVPERGTYYGFLTIAETLDYYIPETSLSTIERRRRIDRALDAVGLTLAQGVPVQELSNLALRRLRIAQALVGVPQVIVLDELISSLDPSAINQFRTILDHVASLGITVLMATHDLSSATLLSTRCIHLSSDARRSGASIWPRIPISRGTVPVS